MAICTVLVLCTGNSARSQMAEGLVNHFLAGRVRALSAGTKPSGYVHPLAIYVMAELGIDIAGHYSKSTDEFLGQRFDYVLTVCDNAAEDCPVWLGGGQRVHIGFDDPAAVQGDEATKINSFRRIRDQIRQQVLGYLEKSSKVAK